MKKSAFIGLLGLFLAISGLILIIAGLFSGGIMAFFGIFGIYIDFLATISIFGLILGLIFFGIGMKVFFENETPFLKMLLGFTGIGLFVAGVIIGIVGSITTVIAIFSLFLLWSLGISLMAYGFEGIKVLKPLSNLISNFKKLLGVKR
jgi:hypothetical protein